MHVLYRTRLRLLREHVPLRRGSQALLPDDSTWLFHPWSLGPPGPGRCCCIYTTYAIDLISYVWYGVLRASLDCAACSAYKSYLSDYFLQKSDLRPLNASESYVYSSFYTMLVLHVRAYKVQIQHCAGDIAFVCSGNTCKVSSTEFECGLSM